MISPIDSPKYQLSPQTTDILRFLERVPLGSSVLVTGCGDGKNNCVISQEGYNAVGIDIDDEKISRAKLCFLTLDFKVADVRQLDDRFEGFRGVWLGNFFSKMEEADKKATLESIKKVLERGGYLYLSVPQVQKEAVAALVEAAGFTVEEQYISFEIKLICRRNE